MTEQPTPQDDTPRPNASGEDFYIETNAPVRRTKPTDEPVVMLPSSMLNTMLIAVTFLVVGVLIGQNLSPRSSGLTAQEAETVVREVLIDANLLTETQSNDVLIDDDPYIGAADAPIVIVEFGDFQCRFCNIHFHETLEPLLENYGPYVRYVYRDFAVLTTESEPAAIAAECADQQGKFWEFHNEFYNNVQYLSRAFYLNAAEKFELDIDAYNACLEDPKTLEEIQKDLTAGQINGISGTPGFLINGTLIRGAQPYVVFEKTLDRELKRLGITKADRPTTDTGLPAMNPSSQSELESEAVKPDPISAATAEAGI